MRCGARAIARAHVVWRCWFATFLTWLGRWRRSADRISFCGASSCTFAPAWVLVAMIGLTRSSASPWRQVAALWDWRWRQISAGCLVHGTRGGPRPGRSRLLGRPGFAHWSAAERRGRSRAAMEGALPFPSWDAVPHRDAARGTSTTPKHSRWARHVRITDGPQDTKKTDKASGGWLEQRFPTLIGREYLVRQGACSRGGMPVCRSSVALRRKMILEMMCRTPGFQRRVRLSVPQYCAVRIGPMDRAAFLLSYASTSGNIHPRRKCSKLSVPVNSDGARSVLRAGERGHGRRS
jgi:hypothetical protein